MNKLYLILLALFLCSCDPVVRRSPHATPYQFVTVESKHDDVAAPALSAASKHLKPVNAEEIKTQGIADRTVVLTVSGGRGFWHCNAEGNFLDLVTRKPVVQIKTRAGFAYAGQDAAMSELLEIIGAESAGITKPQQ